MDANPLDGIARLNKSIPQRLGNDQSYGSGFDGNVVISTNTSLSRDMYYNNLTINSGIHLNTNGFKVFVKDTLTLNGTIGIRSTDSASTGTVSGNTPAATAVTYAIGGSNTTQTATQVSPTILSNIENIIFGGLFTTAGALEVFKGGAGGNAGANGVLDTNTAAPTTWPGKDGAAGTAGGAGGSGSAGQYPPHAHLVGHHSGRGGDGHAGTPGSPGTAGSQGTAGTTGTAGTGGAGGSGGAVVLVLAKNVSGSGTIFSQGKGGASGTPAVNGVAGSTGAAGAKGADGSDGTVGHVPGAASFAGHVNNYHHGRPAHHGGHDHHTTPLPHFHNPHYHTHGYVHHDHYQIEVGDAPGHHYNVIRPGYHHNPGHSHHARPADHFFHRGGVNHNHYHSHNPTGGTHGGFAHMHDHGHHGHGDPGSHGNYKGHTFHHGHRFHQIATAWTAGPALHSYHYHANWPSGAGGAAGAKGIGGAGGVGGPGGRAGTPTAGSAGIPGGGGGIILVTEATPPSVLFNTGGGTSAGQTANSGLQLVVLNS
jgi:hypothetical protein